MFHLTDISPFEMQALKKSKINMSEPQTIDQSKRISSSEQFNKECKRFSERFDGGNRNKTFHHIVAAPIHYEPNFAYPLIVWLHDSEKTETEILETIPKISARNYVAVAPRGISCYKKRLVRSSVNGNPVQEKCWIEPCFSWQDTEDGVIEAENLVFDSIAEAYAKYNVNMRRIFLVGRGVGGTMALQVAMRNPHEFAGVVCIDGALPATDSIPLRNWSALRDLPVLVTSGKPNSTIAPSLNKNLLRLYHTAGLTVLVRQYNEENSTEEALNARMKAVLTDVNRWIMERATNPRTPSSEILASCSLDKR